ncbi:GNAT family N-acetyltransferase [Phaeobacter sp.]|uniref:GNAT family N-acetyltransferase n=1 Tax=Phaeobacter sp. TaxID=1902409 RepID=UPI0025E594DB|nr:GNAT family N-acetyltransferase [Phaeobacter sp.]
MTLTTASPAEAASGSLVFDPTALAQGRYRLRLVAGTDPAVAVAQQLRATCFGLPEADKDQFDAAAQHLLVETTDEGELVACCRLCLLTAAEAGNAAATAGADLSGSYTASRYDLSALTAQNLPMLELGRFCIHPERPDADILRLIWGALAQMVDHAQVRMLIGCTSFVGCDPAPYLQALTQLYHHHQPPNGWSITAQVEPHLPLADLALPTCDLRQAQRQMPALLRSYLAMGGWVGDHLVVDHALDTLHVFTAVDIAAIPPARKRWLRAVSDTRS